jgi:Pyruvate/2-oxoacid:ferredoxin oxidoreductase delta subunit
MKRKRKAHTSAVDLSTTNGTFAISVCRYHRHLRAGWFYLNKSIYLPLKQHGCLLDRFMRTVTNVSFTLKASSLHECRTTGACFNCWSFALAQNRTTVYRLKSHILVYEYMFCAGCPTYLGTFVLGCDSWCSASWLIHSPAFTRRLCCRRSRR